MNPNGNRFILGRQVELIYRNQALGQVISIAIATFLAWIAHGEGLALQWAALWWVAALGIALYRLGMSRRYMQQDAVTKESTIEVWHRRVRAGSLSSGLIWGAGALLMTFAHNLSLQLFSAFVMAGVTAGAIPVLGADRVAYRLFAWPIIISVIVGVAGLDHLHIGFAFVSILALVIFTRSADEFDRMIKEAVQLEHDKGSLLGRVEQALQIAERSDRAKTEFLANISHELRTPLGGIIGLAELLDQDDDLTAGQRELLTPLRESASVLMRQIEQLIQLSALEAGHVQIHPAPFAVPELLDALLSAHRKSAARKGLKLEQHGAADLPRILIGDLACLRQVIDLLVGNAIKFTEMGTVSITAHPMGHSAGKVLIEFAVSDTGPGIPTSKLEQMQGLFTQADGSLIRRHTGIGIGLPISRKLVELMGGELQIESTAGVGSTFRFTLPFATSTDPLLDATGQP